MNKTFYITIALIIPILFLIGMVWLTVGFTTVSTSSYYFVDLSEEDLMNLKQITYADTVRNVEIGKIELIEGHQVTRLDFKKRKALKNNFKKYIEVTTTTYFESREDVEIYLGSD